MYIKSIIFYGEKPLNQVYAHATKWQVFKYRLYQFRFRSLRIILILSILALTAFIARLSFPKTIYTSIKNNPETITITNDTLTPAIERLKQSLITSIQECEQGPYSEDDAPTILDTNNKMSYGVLMFQKKTVQYYYKTLYKQDITPKEAVLIALDEKKARQLAYDIIFDPNNSKHNGWVNWENCSIKRDVKGQLNIINQLIVNK